jgi:hypothetical protein
VTRRAQLAFGEVVVLEAQPARTVGAMSWPVYATWPCPGCEQRRPLDDAWMLRVHDEGETERPWNLLVCAICTRTIALDEPSVDEAAIPDRGQPGDTLTRND